MSSADLEICATLRDNVHNLNLDDPKDKKRYHAYRATFIILLEGARTRAYDDKTGQTIQPGGPKPEGNVTVGIGFNMNPKSARSAWTDVFGNTVSFDDVKAGRAVLTAEQVEKLLNHMLEKREENLEEMYGKKAWDRLKPNERLAIESAYFNGPRTVDANSDFYKLIKAYLMEKSSLTRKRLFKKALHELRERSNPDRNDGIANRRAKEAEMLDSLACPFYRGPGKTLDKAGAFLSGVQIKVNDVILPRMVDDWPKPSLEETQFYIWRTAGDSRVRPEHQRKDGRVYQKGLGAAPGEACNCRCNAVPLPYILSALLPEKDQINTQAAQDRLKSEMFHAFNTIQGDPNALPR